MVVQGCFSSSYERDTPAVLGARTTLGALRRVQHDEKERERESERARERARESERERERERARARERARGRGRESENVAGGVELTCLGLDGAKLNLRYNLLGDGVYIGNPLSIEYGTYETIMARFWPGLNLALAFR